MRRSMITGALMLALMGLAGCSDTNSWFGSSPNTTTGPTTTTGETGTVPSGTSGASTEDTDANATGTSAPSPNTQPAEPQRPRRGAGDDGVRVFPGTITTP